jgi:RNA polymerase sigma-70 factor, ECF subfamily
MRDLLADRPSHQTVCARSLSPRGSGATGVASFNLLARVRSIVFAVLNQLVGTTDPEFEDLLQTALVNIFISFERGAFRGNCSPEYWAATIARNVAVDELRTRYRSRQLFGRAEKNDELSFASPALSPESLADLHSKAGRILCAMSRLGPDKGNVVFLHDALGYELSEIAAMVGTSLAAAQSRLFRGRAAIIRNILVRSSNGRGTSHRFDGI